MWDAFESEFEKCKIKMSRWPVEFAQEVAIDNVFFEGDLRSLSWNLGEVLKYS